jgi:hypothetical protein
MRYATRDGFAKVRVKQGLRRPPRSHLTLETHIAYVNTTPAAIAVAAPRLPTAVANGGRGGSSFGAPRYGVKPKVMLSIPKPTIT